MTLLKAGADIKARPVGKTALMLASRFNEGPDVIIILLKVGADAKAKDIEGKTAWNWAQGNEKLKGTKAYWALNDAQY